MKALTCAAIALVCGVGAANAAVTVDHANWTTTISGLDSYLTGVRSGEGYQSYTVYTFALPADFFTSQVTLFLDEFDGATKRINEYGVYWDVSYEDGYSNGGVAFGASQSSFLLNGQLMSTTSVTPSLRGQDFFPQEGLPAGGVTSTIYDLSFKGGSGLNPSSDPSCGSFSCMEPFTTKGVLRVSITAFVPEPESLALAFAGLSVIGAGALVRRRA